MKDENRVEINVNWAMIMIGSKSVLMRTSLVLCRL